MRLYHFTTAEYGLLAIEKQRLKIARISALNDPFELLGWNLRDASVRAKLGSWKTDSNEKIGILCFSRKWSNPLLWSHYADKHKGIALGFNVPNGEPYRAVKYRRTRLPTPLGRAIVGSDIDDLVFTKYTAWRYESEYRCGCDLEASIKENDLFFEPFSDDLKLAEIIIGCDSTVTRAEIDAVLGPRRTTVDAFKARAAFGTFSVVKNRKSSLWR